MQHETAIALARFGLGPRSGETPPGDPHAWAVDQLSQQDPLALQDRELSNQGLTAVAQKHAAAHERKLAGDTAKPKDNPVRDIFMSQSDDFLANALTTAQPFRERLVWFWANHFTIARVSDVTAAVLHAYIREAIRPHVTGRFVDMLLAVMRHPGMLDYLNQAQSVGPNSRAGQRMERGLNENLARECLELHTVTPASGYTQADVTSFAKVLTGWSVGMQPQNIGWMFRPNAHEPGSKQVMGKIWPEGEEGGVMLLTWLAGHPSTHRHLAEKLTRHFCADKPAEADIRAVEGALRDSGGDLGAATLELLGLHSAWAPLQKFRAPMDYVIAAGRAVGTPPTAARQAFVALQQLGQPLWKAPFPIGWPDRASDWASEEALLQRVEFSLTLADRTPQLDPSALGNALLGPLLSADTLSAMRHAGSRRDAFALLFSSPEFQRR